MTTIHFDTQTKHLPSGKEILIGIHYIPGESDVTFNINDNEVDGRLISQFQLSEDDFDSFIEFIDLVKKNRAK